MYHSFPERDKMAAPLLYFMFAKLEMENNRPNEALKILVSISDNIPYSKVNKSCISTQKSHKIIFR